MGDARTGRRPRDDRVVIVDDTDVPMLSEPLVGGSPLAYAQGSLIFTPRRKIGDVDRGAPPPLEGRSSISGTVFNLMNTMIGAGLMALPHVYAMTGIPLGVFMTVVVAVFMYTCSKVLVRAADQTCERTYTELARNQLGPWSGLIIQWSIILNNAGILLVYLIIIGDLMVGTADSGYNGLLTSWLDIHTGNVWFVSRWFVVLMVCIIFIVPLVFQKRLHVLANTSAFAIGLASAFAVVTTVLAIIAGVKGEFPEITWGINAQMTEPDIIRNCMTAIVMTGIPVMLYAFVYLFNVPPLMAELRDYTPGRMVKAVKYSIVATAALYIVVGVTASLIFGQDTHQDVLVNLNPKALQTFLSPRLADTMSSLIAIGYCGKLILIFPLGNWSLRENLSDLFFGTQRPQGWKFNVMTAGILFVVYIMSLTFRSVLNAIDIIGCTAAVGISFIIPAYLIKKFEPGNGMKLFGVVVYFTGLFCLFEGVLGEVWREAFHVPLFC